MALIHQGALKDFPEKLVKRATLSLVGFDMVIWGVGWDRCGEGCIWDGVGDCLEGAIGARPTGRM